jgi:carbamoyltransferase
MKILGISAFYHDSAASLLDNGKIISAAQEERFTRIKHDSSFPLNAIQYCLKQGKINFDDIDHIVFYEKPFLKFERILETYFAFAPKGFTTFRKSLPIWIKEKLFQKKLLIDQLKSISNQEHLIKNKLLFSEHHLSHAASAFFPSPFENAAILTLDGVGEWTTTSLAIGEKNKLKIIKEIHFPHSIGLLYSAFTYFTGFKVNSGEYKLMGLAPYGEPVYVDIIKNNLIDIKDDGSFHLDMSYFDYCTGLTMTSNKFHKLFGRKPKEPNSKLTQLDMDLAASIQKVTEEIIIKLCKSIAETTKQKNLCLAGGVALNCVANGILLKEKIFDNIWIQPAAGDAGGSLGAAFCAYYLDKKCKRTIDKNDSMKGSFLGPEFKTNDIKVSLSKLNASYLHEKEDKIVDRTAHALASGKAVGWMQGRMEFGPRALGCRSILADPRSEKMQKILNLKVKFRESFRPFAPSVLEDDLSQWFELSKKSPYMLFVSQVSNDKLIKMNQDQKKLFGLDKLYIKRSIIPAVTHVDYTARIQSVDKNTNRVFYNLIKKFKSLTGCPVLVNTSFNVRGEPIVCTPEDAFNCFMGTDLDTLIIGNFYLDKKAQNPSLKKNYLNKYEPD